MIVYDENGNWDYEKSTDDVEEEEYKYPCPVCGNITLPYKGSGYPCHICGWFDDPGQSEDEPDEKDCANNMSLNEAREAFRQRKEIY